MTRPQNQNPTMVLKRYRPRHSPARCQCRAEQTWQRDSQKPDLGNMKGKSLTIGRYLVDECRRERDEMLGQVLAFPFHDRVKPALAEVTIPFLKILPLGETDINRRPVRGARKRCDNANKPTKRILAAHDARDSAHILRLLYAVHAPHGFGHFVKPDTQNVAEENVSHCTSLVSHIWDRMTTPAGTLPARTVPCGDTPRPVEPLP